MGDYEIIDDVTAMIIEDKLLTYGVRFMWYVVLGDVYLKATRLMGIFSTGEDTWTAFNTNIDKNNNLMLRLKGEFEVYYLAITLPSTDAKEKMIEALKEDKWISPQT